MNTSRNLTLFIFLFTAVGCVPIGRVSNANFYVTSTGASRKSVPQAAFVVIDAFAQRKGFIKAVPGDYERINPNTGKPTGLDMHRYILSSDLNQKQLKDPIFLQASRLGKSRIFIQIFSGDGGRSQILVDQLRAELIAELRVRGGPIAIPDPSTR